MFFSLTAFQIYNKNDRLGEKMKMFVRGEVRKSESRKSPEEKKWAKQFLRIRVILFVGGIDI